MLNLKTIWPKKKPEAVAAQPLTSIPRQLSPASRPDFRPPVEEQPVFNIDTRAAERFVPRRTTTVLVTESGKKIGARIINVSALGVAIEADFSQISPQTITMIGERRVQPGRKISRGTVFLFVTPLPLNVCGPDFIL